MLLDELNDRCEAIEQAERDGDTELSNELKIAFNERMNENLPAHLKPNSKNQKPKTKK